MKYIINGIRLIFLGLFIFLISRGNMMLWLGLYGASLLLALVFGRIYCAYACPMNTLMVPTDFIAKKLKIQRKDAPKWLASGKLPWFTLIGSLLIMVLGKRVFEKNIPILLIWLVLSVLISIRYKPSVFHNLICPFGKPQSIFAGFTRFSETVDPDLCIGCKLCEGVCPSDAIAVGTDKKAEINKSLCHQCTNCSQVCPTQAISYSKQ